MDSSVWEIVKSAAIVVGAVAAIAVSVTRVRENDVSSGWRRRRRGPRP